MPAHIQVTISSVTPAQTEELIAHLDECGATGFEETDGNLMAFWPASNFDAKVISDVLSGFDYKTIEIADTNWNEVWESGFQPVVIGDFAAIRAGFHEPIDHVRHELVITPKMSFGTGHHATTTLMILQMKEIDFTGKRVFDFGTGTGVLAILAEKLGAGSVLAIDNDDWSIVNAEENIAQNHCEKIDLRKAGSANLADEFDCILANINRHIILENFAYLRQQLKPGGVLLLSGLLAGDEPLLIQAATGLGFRLEQKTEKDNWLCMSMS